MKQLKYFSTLILFACLISITSCELNDFEKDEFSWSKEAKVYLTPTENAAMLYVEDGAASFFMEPTMTYEVSVLAAELDDFSPGSVEIYAFVEEMIDGVAVLHGGSEGKKLTEISEFVNNKAEISVTIEQISELFGSELQTDLNGESIIELKYVTTDVNGVKYDSRLNCNGGHCQEIVRIDTGVACQNHLEGIYNYEIIEKGVGFSFGTVGATGTITIERLNPFGVYGVSDMYFGHNAWFGVVPAEMHETDCEGIISFPGATYDAGWEFRNFDGASVEVIVAENFYANYMAWYNGYVYFIVRLTRVDGQPIPIVQGEYERMLPIL